MPKDPREVAAKWKQRASSASQDWENGIMRVTEAPGIKAAAAEDKMLRNFTEAITSGRWREKVSSVTLADWQRKCKDKGKANYQTGIAAGEDKMAAAMADLLPQIEQIKNSLPPRGDLEQNLARAAEFGRRMAQLKR